MEGRWSGLVLIINLTLKWKKWLSLFQHFFFPLKLRDLGSWVTLGSGDGKWAKECGGTATFSPLCLAALQTAMLLFAYCEHPLVHSHSLQCLALQSPGDPWWTQQRKAGKKGTESSGVTRTRCMYSIDFCSFGVLYEVMDKARKNTQEICNASYSKYSRFPFIALFFFSPILSLSIEGMVWPSTKTVSL